jgi:hypothetical protein
MREDDDGQFRSVRDPLRRARPAPPRMLNWMNAAGVLLRLVGQVYSSAAPPCAWRGWTLLTHYDDDLMASHVKGARQIILAGPPLGYDFSRAAERRQSKRHPFRGAAHCLAVGTEQQSSSR